MTATSTISRPDQSVAASHSLAPPWLDHGLRNLTEAELIAQVLEGPDPAVEVLRYGQRLARLPFWERRALGAAGLTRHHGVPPQHASRLAALWELAERWFPDERPAVESPRDAVLLFTNLADAHAETVMVLMLDARYGVLGVETIAVGGVNAASVQPRDVFVPALRAGAAAVVLAHSHPSGDAAPSRSDRQMTMVLREAAAVVGVPLLDHLVVARRGFYSFSGEETWTDTPRWTTDAGDSSY